MAASNVNVIVITGNLTSDPELRSLPSGTSVCKMRVACNTRTKRDGEWTDKPNYFDVTVWGAQGENSAKYLSKGRGVAIQGRMEWREWEDKEGNKRQSYEIVAETVQFLGGGEGGSGSSRSDVPTDDTSAPVTGSVGPPPDPDDIPFACDGFPAYDDRRGHSRW